MYRKYYILLFIIINKVFACAVCYGEINDPMADGMNNAILFLIGTITFVLLSIIGTSFHFYYKSKKIS